MATRPSRRSSAHEEAVARRLALLGAELAVVRGQDRAPTYDDLGFQDYSDSDDVADDGHTRIRPGRQPVRWDDPAGDPTGDPTGGGEVGVVPVPGRHSSRRPSALAAALPPLVRGRLALGPAQLAVVALVVLLGVLAAGWWLWHGRPAEYSVPSQPGRELVSLDPVPSAEATQTAGAAVATPGPAPASASVTVDVAGRVRRPGIAVLDAGARVVDALKAAGGARDGVDLTDLNLARVLVDGEQILVGVAPPAGVAASVPGGTSPVAALVNLNTADQVALESLPEVGPVTAQSILAWREENGSFTSVDQLLDVDGIGEATLAKLTPFVTL
jgi:competence protein ComEA